MGAVGVLVMAALEAEHGLEVDLAIGGGGCCGAECASGESIGFAEQGRGEVSNQRRQVDVVRYVAANSRERQSVAA